jgi:hypothetical protein
MEQQTEQYFLTLISSKKNRVVLYGDEPVLNLHKQLKKTLDLKKIKNKEIYDDSKPIPTSTKTLCVCTEDDGLSSIELYKIINTTKKLKTIVVQTMSMYTTCANIVTSLGKNNIVIIGFKRGSACFVNSGMYGNADIHPFFIVKDTPIPKNDNLDWVGWSTFELKYET